MQAPIFFLKFWFLQPSKRTLNSVVCEKPSWHSYTYGHISKFRKVQSTDKWSEKKTLATKQCYAPSHARGSLLCLCSCQACRLCEQKNLALWLGGRGSKPAGRPGGISVGTGSRLCDPAEQYCTAPPAHATVLNSCAFPIRDSSVLLYIAKNSPTVHMQFHVSLLIFCCICFQSFL